MKKGELKNYVLALLPRLSDGIWIFFRIITISGALRTVRYVLLFRVSFGQMALNEIIDEITLNIIIYTHLLRFLIMVSLLNSLSSFFFQRQSADREISSSYL